MTQFTAYTIETARGRAADLQGREDSLQLHPQPPVLYGRVNLTTVPWDAAKKGSLKMTISSKIMRILALAISLAPLPAMLVLMVSLEANGARMPNGDQRLVHQTNLTQSCTNVQKGFWSRPNECAR
jgi:hypothetical protein